MNNVKRSLVLVVIAITGLGCTATQTRRTIPAPTAQASAADVECRIVGIDEGTPVCVGTDGYVETEPMKGQCPQGTRLKSVLCQERQAAAQPEVVVEQVTTEFGVPYPVAAPYAYAPPPVAYDYPPRVSPYYYPRLGHAQYEAYRLYGPGAYYGGGGYYGGGYYRGGGGGFTYRKGNKVYSFGPGGIYIDEGGKKHGHGNNHGHGGGHHRGDGDGHSYRPPRFRHFDIVPGGQGSRGGGSGIRSTNSGGNRRSWRSDGGGRRNGGQNQSNRSFRSQRSNRR